MEELLQVELHAERERRMLELEPDNSPTESSRQITNHVTDAVLRIKKLLQSRFGIAKGLTVSEETHANEAMEQQLPHCHPLYQGSAVCACVMQSC